MPSMGDEGGLHGAKRKQVSEGVFRDVQVWGGIISVYALAHHVNRLLNWYICE